VSLGRMISVISDCVLLMVRVAGLAAAELMLVLLPCYRIDHAGRAAGRMKLRRPEWDVLIDTSDSSFGNPRQMCKCPAMAETAMGSRAEQD
jgi:hypothetical protein